MLAALLATAMLVMRARPGSDCARYLHLLLVERPLRWAARVERRQLIYATGLLVLVLVGGEFVMMLGSFDTAAAAVWDVSVLLDSAIAVTTLATVARLRPSLVWIATRLPVRRPRKRMPRTCRQPSTTACNDDEPAHAVRAA